VTPTYREQPTSLALHFFLLAGAVVSVACLGGWSLIEFSRGISPGEFQFPRVFWLSTISLLTGSVAMERSSVFVSREQQTPFRTHLIVALISGTAFVALQIFGLWVLLRSQEPEFAVATSQTAVALGVKPYVFVAAFLHGMHFFLALLFMVYVTLNGFTGRYDHEYFWGVRVCAWFWHGLGVVWIMILVVFAIVSIR